ncbi:protease SohB, partial [Francisella tularensis subsp. holarctica]|nr:protease SohB [Francisella tularensis subsp. holarctica]
MWYQIFIGFVFFAVSTVLVVAAIVIVIGSFFSFLIKAKQEAANLAKGMIEINEVATEYKQTKQ